MFGTAYYARIWKMHVIFAYKRKQIIIMEENCNFLDENSYFFLKLLYFLLNFGKIIVFCTKFWTFKQIIFRSAFFWFRCFSHRNRNRNHKKHRNRNLRFRSIPRSDPSLTRNYGSKSRSRVNMGQKMTFFNFAEIHNFDVVSGFDQRAVTYFGPLTRLDQLFWVKSQIWRFRFFAHFDPWTGLWPVIAGQRLVGSKKIYADSESARST